MNKQPEIANKDLAIQLRNDLCNKDFILLYAYNGIGKTRLSMEFKKIGKQQEQGIDTLYFNAFTEDLFYWDNDLDGDSKRFLKFNSNSKFFGVLEEERLIFKCKINKYLKRYVNFDFKIDYDDFKICFTKDKNKNIKISKGEENIFIWCFFLAIIQLVIDKNKSSYAWVKYFYIDDPISSLDDNNVIAVASDLAHLLKEGKNEKKIKAVISSHHSLFFNVMCNELKKNKHKKYFLNKDKETNKYLLQNTSETPFLYHISIIDDLQKAVNSNKLHTYHFNMLRNVLEKTAVFFGFKDFSACLNHEDEVLYSRALNLLSHGNHSIYQPKEMAEDDKKLFRKIFNNFLEKYKFNLTKDKEDTK